MMPNYIFVYGTLKRDGFNNYLLDGCSFIGIGVAMGFVLVDMGGCPGMMPGVVTRHDHNDDAVGEVYGVSDEELPHVLARLDQLENEGSLYVRVKAKIQLYSNTIEDAVHPIECVTYLFMPNLNPDSLVKGGEWNAMRVAEVQRRGP
jgi:gamma-glutamylcyclotransferase (GGCT)/AIG2-like uncharacterized protein YtfP